MGRICSFSKNNDKIHRECFTLQAGGIKKSTAAQNASPAALFYLVLQVIKLYSYVVIANVVISWLVAFNVLNTTNRFVYSVLEFTYRLTDPILNRIRGFLPNLGAFDISPIILLLLLWFIEMCMKIYIAPIIF